MIPARACSAAARFLALTLFEVSSDIPTVEGGSQECVPSVCRDFLSFVKVATRQHGPITVPMNNYAYYEKKNICLVACRIAALHFLYPRFVIQFSEEKHGIKRHISYLLLCRAVMPVACVANQTW